ncbi:MAG TPA: hypothetical protein VE133_07480, partial [Candidatus Sulfotelmatobacter sp.]|nr:hypothetical protein [Candidatus Sulfotelmatobacter sp.]
VRALIFSINVGQPGDVSDSSSMTASQRQSLTLAVSPLNDIRTRSSNHHWQEALQRSHFVVPL